jgi:hypothetical protein
MRQKDGGQKYSVLVNGWAISSEPAGLPSGPLTMLPLALKEKKVWPMAHTASG